MFVEGSNPAPYIGLRRSIATSEAAFRGSVGTKQEWTAPMFEENEVLTQIRALRQEVGSRLDDMDQRLKKIEAEFARPAAPAQASDSRLEEIDRRLQSVESRLAPQPLNGSFLQDGGYAEPQVQAAPPAAPVPTRQVTITISPLYDVAHVSVVEAALRAIVGVESVTLQSLKGDGAEIVIDIQEGVSLIAGLRRTLPVAFDVSDADNSSFTLGLVQPAVDPQADAVVQRTL
jgi:tetrahydromethanopterin S-methyltransferase subunit G